MSSKTRGPGRSRSKKPAKARVNGNHAHAKFMRGPMVSVERACGDLRRGFAVIVHRKNKSFSLVAAAEGASEQLIAAMQTWSRSLPNVLLTHERATTLKIRLYTPGVVSVQLTQQNAALAARALADPTRDIHDPLMGPWVASREALSPTAVTSVRLVKLAELLPAALVCPLSVSQARAMIASNNLLAVDADDVDHYASGQHEAFRIAAMAQLPLEGAENTRVLAFRPKSGGREHLALIIGTPEPPGPTLVRLHSECLTGDILGSLKCDCGHQLRGAFAAIAAQGSGILLYLCQEGRGIGLINKLKAYELQDQGFDTIEANTRLGFESDARNFSAAAEILKYLGYSRIRLLTNNPDKVQALKKHGLEMVERVAHHFPTNPHNAGYIATKKQKAGHLS